MFVEPTYLHIYDNESDDEEANEDHFKEPWVVKLCELMKLDDTSLNVEKREGSQPTFKFIHPMEKMFVRMGDIMQENINEFKEAGVQLIDHTTSLLDVIGTNVQGICPSKANKFVHPDIAFHCNNVGLGNLVHWMKD